MCCSSVAKLSPTLHDPTDCSMRASRSFPSFRSFAQTHVHSRRWRYLSTSSSASPFSSCPQSFAASESFAMSQLFASDGQSTGAAASIIPMNIQDWFPLGLIGWSPCTAWLIASLRDASPFPMTRLWPTKGTWRLPVPKTVKRMLVRPPMTNVKMTVRADCAVSACSPLLLSIKALAHWLPVGRVSLWTDVCPPPPQLLAPEIKQISLSTNLTCLLAFQQQAARPYLWVTVLQLIRGSKVLLRGTGLRPVTSRNPEMMTNPWASFLPHMPSGMSAMPSPSAQGPEDVWVTRRSRSLAQSQPAHQHVQVSEYHADNKAVKQKLGEPSAHPRHQDWRPRIWFSRQCCKQREKSKQHWQKFCLHGACVLVGREDYWTYWTR